jgi:CMP-2-keto-3-deoxyoctulosonic acid synthetase
MVQLDQTIINLEGDMPLMEKRLLVMHQFKLCVAHMVCAIIATLLVQIY